jgi:hypothetical protein
LLLLLGAVAVLGVAAVGAWSGWFAANGGGSTAAGAASAPSISQNAVDRAAGVEVDMASVDLGSVPLDTAVEHKFRLRNTGEERATLGRVRIEVLEGC